MSEGRPKVAQNISFSAKSMPGRALSCLFVAVFTFVISFMLHRVRSYVHISGPLARRGFAASKRRHLPPSTWPPHNRLFCADKPIPSPTIVLLPEEEALFKTLLTFTEANQLHTTIRVAGGWVRDKLLGIQGKKDIDFALDNITGRKFINLFRDWLDATGQSSLRGLGIVNRNPDKSKHLETAVARFEDMSLDFVNLRTERYHMDSRIPEMDMGTAIEDASRRDLTINALFYNLATKQVEDLTGQGLRDLEHKIIRTPLLPLITLQDDPLRALRAVRFACRFDFTISPDLLDAISHPDARQAFVTKISHARVHNELRKMLGGPGYHRAISLLDGLHWMDLIFGTNVHPHSVLAVLMMEAVKPSSPLVSKLMVFVHEPDNQRHIVLALILNYMEDKRLKSQQSLMQNWMAMSRMDSKPTISILFNEAVRPLLSSVLHPQPADQTDFMTSTDFATARERIYGGRTVSGINQLLLGLAVSGPNFANALFATAVHVMMEQTLVKLQDMPESTLLVNHTLSRHLGIRDHPVFCGAPSEAMDRALEVFQQESTAVMAAMEVILTTCKHYNYTVFEEHIPKAPLNGNDFQKMLPALCEAKPWFIKDVSPHPSHLLLVSVLMRI